MAGRAPPPSAASAPARPPRAAMRARVECAGALPRMDLSGAVVLPGEVVGVVGARKAGVGTYESDGTIRASVAGLRVDLAGSEAGEAATVCVQRVRDSAVIAPRVGDEVLARVTRITRRAADADILGARGRALREPYRAVLRRENVRATDVDRVKVEDSVRPGDVIRAVVASLGDARSLALSTAGSPYYGVVFATAADGTPLRPVSDQEMEHPVTGVRERRKAAKPL
jgi:exosome complex component CSL4